MKPLLSVVLLASAGVFTSSIQAQESNSGATIFGNREMPNITYVVPWKEDQVDVVEVQPVGNLFDEALLPIDRDVFVREIEYFELLQGGNKNIKP
jgi:hypothetical protein